MSFPSLLRANLGYVHMACICPGFATPIALGEIILLRVFLLPINDKVGQTDEKGPSESRVTPVGRLECNH